MKQIRTARPEDQAQFRALWNISFSDTDRFRDWFFAHRFVPAYSYVIEEDGRVVSAVQSIPVHLLVRGRIVPSSIMVGACTHPEYKRRGYMKELYTFYMRQVRKKGILLAAHTPAVLGTYFYVGHYPVSDTAFLEGTAEGVLPTQACEVDLKKDVSDLYVCYAGISRSYSGMVSRSYADMVLKMQDYAADGGQAVAYWVDGQVAGYAVYYDTPEEVYAEEVLAQTDNVRQEVVHALWNRAAGKKVKVKLPPDVSCHLPGAKRTVGPRNVAGVADVAALLRILDVPTAYTIGVKDAVVEENDGIFAFDGSRSSQTPVFWAEQGHVLQFLMGYRSLAQLAEEGHAQILDAQGVQELDRLLPTVPCFIIDEY